LRRLFKLEKWTSRFACLSTVAGRSAPRHNVRDGCAPCKGGAFQWVQAPPGTGLVENLAAFKQHLIVERDPNDPNRVNVLYPPDLINQLRIFAVLAQFRLQYDRGIDTQIIGTTQPPFNAASGA